MENMSKVKPTSLKEQRKEHVERRSSSRTQVIVTSELGMSHGGVRWMSKGLLCLPACLPFLPTDVLASATSYLALLLSQETAKKHSQHDKLHSWKEDSSGLAAIQVPTTRTVVYEENYFPRWMSFVQL